MFFNYFFNNFRLYVFEVRLFIRIDPDQVKIEQYNNNRDNK